MEIEQSFQSLFAAVPICDPLFPPFFPSSQSLGYSVLFLSQELDHLSVISPSSLTLLLPTSRLRVPLLSLSLQASLPKFTPKQVPVYRRSYCIHHTNSRLANVTSLAQTPTLATMSEQAQNQLPRTILPSHYDFCIKTDLESLSFTGAGTITVNVSEPVQSLIINAASPLKVETAVLASTSLKTESVRPATKIQVDEKRERIEVSFAGGEIPKGEHKIGFRWNGKLDTSMLGYYRSGYPLKGGKEGEKAYYALTQFEPCMLSICSPFHTGTDSQMTTQAKLDVLS